MKMEEFLVCLTTLESSVFGESIFVRTSYTTNACERLQKLVAAVADNTKKMASGELSAQNPAKECSCYMQYTLDTPRFPRSMQAVEQFSNSSPYVMVDPSTLGKLPLHLSAQSDDKQPHQFDSIEDLEAAKVTPMMLSSDVTIRKEPEPTSLSDGLLHGSHLRLHQTQNNLMGPSGFSLCSGSSRRETCPRNENSTSIVINLPILEDINQT